MVYCGKPSKACEECRVRRTKCDTLRPSCSQCSRAGRLCRGYRNPTDMMFRDESQALSTKRQRLANAKKSRPVATATPSKETESNLVCRSLTTLKPQFGHSNLNPTSFLTPDLGASAEEQASCFFFRNYVLEEHKFHNGSFQYLSDMYAYEEIGEALAETVACLGLAGLANFWKAPNIMAAAKAKYNMALRLISSRLRTVEEAKSDQTLVAVMLLGLYETNTCSGRQSMESWTKHINGAAALLNLRGKQQLQTQIGRNLFIHLRTLVITNCVQRHVTVPPMIGEWSRVALEHETEAEALSTRFTEIATNYCSIRASMSSFHDYSNSEFLVASLCAIDLEYTELLSTCPIPFIYSTVTLDETSDEIFSDHYHVYSSIWVATIWNYYRCVRMLVNELILDQTSYILQHPEEFPSSWESVPFYQRQILASNSTMQKLSHDICASVPFYLGYSVKLSDPALRSPPKTISGNLVMWPLYTAACTGAVSDIMRVWVTGRLRFISEVMGIRQAAPLAYILEVKQDLLEWEGETGESETALLDFVQ